MRKIDMAYDILRALYSVPGFDMDNPLWKKRLNKEARADRSDVERRYENACKVLNHKAEAKLAKAEAKLVEVLGYTKANRPADQTATIVYNRVREYFDGPAPWDTSTVQNLVQNLPE